MKITVRRGDTFWTYSRLFRVFAAGAAFYSKSNDENKCSFYSKKLMDIFVYDPLKWKIRLMYKRNRFPAYEAYISPCNKLCRPGTALDDCAYNIISKCGRVI